MQQEALATSRTNAVCAQFGAHTSDGEATLRHAAREGVSLFIAPKSQAGVYSDSLIWLLADIPGTHVDDATGKTFEAPLIGQGMILGDTARVIRRSGGCRQGRFVDALRVRRGRNPHAIQLRAAIYPKQEDTAAAPHLPMVFAMTRRSAIAPAGVRHRPRNRPSLPSRYACPESHDMTEQNSRINAMKSAGMVVAESLASPGGAVLEATV